MKEEWRDILGYEGRYQISGLGKVKSLARKGRRLDKILKPKKDRSGYRVVHLLDNGYREFKIHRLVAIAFIKNPNHKPCVNHKNGIKTDNRLSNLEWCTHGENNKHAWESGLMEHARELLKKRPPTILFGEESSNAKLKNHQILDIRKKYQKGINQHQRGNGQKLAKQYGISIRNIHAIIKRESWKTI